MFAYLRFHTKPNEMVVFSAECDLQVGSNRYSFILGDTEMVCAPGTIFNETECVCVADDNPEDLRKYAGQQCFHPLHVSVDAKEMLRKRYWPSYNEEPCKIRHQWQHLTHQVITTCIVTHNALKYIICK